MLYTENSVQDKLATLKAEFAEYLNNGPAIVKSFDLIQIQKGFIVTDGNYCALILNAKDDEELLVLGTELLREMKNKQTVDAYNYGHDFIQAIYQNMKYLNDHESYATVQYYERHIG